MGKKVTASELHPLYNNLFAGPTKQQMEQLERNRQAEVEYIQTVHAYNKEFGQEMPLDQAKALYATIKAKYA